MRERSIRSRRVCARPPTPPACALVHWLCHGRVQAAARLAAMRAPAPRRVPSRERRGRQPTGVERGKHAQRPFSGDQSRSRRRMFLAGGQASQPPEPLSEEQPKKRPSLLTRKALLLVGAIYCLYFLSAL